MCWSVAKDCQCCQCDRLTHLLKAIWDILFVEFSSYFLRFFVYLELHSKSNLDNLSLSSEECSLETKSVAIRVVSVPSHSLVHFDFSALWIWVNGFIIVLIYVSRDSRTIFCELRMHALSFLSYYWNAYNVTFWRICIWAYCSITLWWKNSLKGLS